MPTMLLYQLQASWRRPKEIMSAALMLLSLCILSLVEQCTCVLVLVHCFVSQQIVKRSESSCLPLSTTLRGATVSL